MALYKNKASQKFAVYAYNVTTGAAVTGDAANITAQISLDGAATAATNDVNPTELDATDAPGIYLFDATQAETNADLIVVAAVSGTANVLLEPLIIYTEPEIRSADAVSISGDSTAADTIELFAEALDQATGQIDSGTFAAGAVTAAAIADGAIDAATFAADVDAEILGYIVDDATRIDASDLNSKIDSLTFTVAGDVDVNVQSWGGAAIAAPSVAGVPEVDVTHVGGAAASTVAGAIDANVVAISGDTGAADNLELAYDGTGYAHTGNTYPWTAAWDAEVQSEVQDALEANNLDHLVKIAVDTNFATTVHLDSVIGQLADAGGTATFDRTTDALEILGAATAPSAASIADAVWEEAIADHSGTVGSTAEALNAAGSAGDPWVTALPGAYGAGSAGFILGTNLNATVSSRASQTSVDDVPTVAEFEARTIVAANYFDPAVDKVFLGDGAHGGTAATITAERIIVASTTGNEPAFKLTGNGSGAGILSTGGATGDGVKFVGGATSGHGAYYRATANSNGIYTQGAGTGDGAHFEAGASGKGAHVNGTFVVAGATTFTGAVGLSSTLTVTGATTLTGGLTGDITGNLSGSVGSVTTKTGYKLASDGMDLVVPADPSAIPVLGTASVVTWIGWFGAWTVNEVNATATEVQLRNSADNADMATHTVSDDGTTFSSSEPA